MKRIAIVLLVLLLPVCGWGTTVYWNSGYYESGASACSDVTAADTAGDVEAALTVAGENGTLYICSDATDAALDSDDSRLDATAAGQTIIGIGSPTLTTTTAAAALYISAVVGTTVSGLTLSGGSSGAVVITNAADSDVELNTTITDCTIYNNTLHGVRNDASKTTLRRCTITADSSGDDAIDSDGNNLEVDNCTLITNSEGDCIQIIGTGDGSDYLWVHDSKLTNNGTTKACIMMQTGTGHIIENNRLIGGRQCINTDGTSSIIRNNYIEASSGNIGVAFDGTTDVLYCNVINNPGGGTHGIDVAGDGTGGKIVNNTFIGSDWTTATIRIESNTDVAELKNNIFNTESTRYISASVTAGVITAMSNNVYPANISGGWLYAGSTYNTLALFQAGASLDGDSFIADPKLNAKTLRPKNPALWRSGTAISAITGQLDGNGNPITARPTIGGVQVPPFVAGSVAEYLTREPVHYRVVAP